MNRQGALIEATVFAVQHGHCGIFTVPQLALLAGERASPAFRKFLASKKDTLPIERIARGLYINRMVPPTGAYGLEMIARLLHPNRFFYLSLEYELSRLGLISQVPIDTLTAMTTGRSGRYKTRFGTIEFTHTKRSIKALSNYVYYDLKAGVFRAKPQQALRDLRRVGRNPGMLVDSTNNVEQGNVGRDY